MHTTGDLGMRVGRKYRAASGVRHGGGPGPGPCMRPPPPGVLKDSGANGANIFVACLVEGGTMPLVLKTLKTFFLAKTRNRHYCIHTPIPACPQTHTPP